MARSRQPAGLPLPAAVEVSWSHAVPARRGLGLPRVRFGGWVPTAQLASTFCPSHSWALSMLCPIKPVLQEDTGKAGRWDCPARDWGTGLHFVPRPPHSIHRGPVCGHGEWILTASLAKRCKKV